MFQFLRRFYQKSDVPDSTLDEWSETYERDLAYLASQLRQQKYDGVNLRHQHTNKTSQKVV
jgi:hypothetical protein